MESTTWLDLETTAAHLRRRPWEIALIQQISDGDGPPVEREILMQITGVDMLHADPEALQVGRYFDRGVDVADPGTPVWRPPAGPRLALGLPAARRREQHTNLVELVDQLTATDSLAPGTTVIVDEAAAAAIVAHWTKNTNMIGLNPWFDTDTLSRMLDRHGYPHEPWNYHLTNLPSEAAGWLRGQLHAQLPEMRKLGAAFELDLLDRMRELTRLPRNSRALSQLCGVAPPEHPEAHTGLGDARWMRRWWDAITITTTPAWMVIDG